MDKEFVKEFTKCPACGSEDRFFESIANELKQRGLAQKGWNFALDSKQGVVGSKQMMDNLPIGSELPTFQFETDICTDICMECGNIYATKFIRGQAKRGLDRSKQPPIDLIDTSGMNLGRN